jgi:hypothetical protein
VRSQRPERVLVRAQLAQIQAVAVDVVDVAELARVGDLLELDDSRVVLEEVPDHQDLAGRFGSGHDLLGVGCRLRDRLLDEAVLARFEHLDRQGRMGRHRRCDDYRVNGVVGQQLADLGRAADAGKTSGPAVERLLRAVTKPGQLRVRQLVEVAGQVRAPVAKADNADPDTSRHRRTRLGAAFPRVTPRKSTTSGDAARTLSKSRPG